MTDQQQKIFILEDDPDFRDDLAEALSASGFQVDCAESIAVADPCALASADVLLLDLALPGLDGIGVLARIKELVAPPSLIFMSGSGEELLRAAAIVARSEGLKVLGTLAKPFDPEDVVHVCSAPVVQPDAHACQSPCPQAILRALRVAVRDATLPVLFQPILTSRHLLFAGAEALLGDTLPGYGYVKPSDIILAASTQPDLLHDLTLLVLRQAVAACAQWTPVSGSAQVSINIPLVVLEMPGIVGRLQGTVQAGGGSPHQVVFELTEDAIYASSPSALGAIAQLRIAGFGIALDDVAQRQSGLLQLSTLPVTEIKIDLELLRQARKWEKARNIFFTLADLGHRLGLTVVAEGVESLDDLLLARSARVDYIQGYIVSRKRPLSELLALQTMLGGTCEPWIEPLRGVA